MAREIIQKERTNEWTADRPKEQASSGRKLRENKMNKDDDNTTKQYKTKRETEKKNNKTERRETKRNVTKQNRKQEKYVAQMINAHSPGRRMHQTGAQSLLTDCLSAHIAMHNKRRLVPSSVHDKTALLWWWWRWRRRRCDLGTLKGHSRRATNTTSNKLDPLQFERWRRRLFVYNKVESPYGAGRPTYKTKQQQQQQQQNHLSAAETTDGLKLKRASRQGSSYEVQILFPVDDDDDNNEMRPKLGL